MSIPNQDTQPESSTISKQALSSTPTLSCSTKPSPTSSKRWRKPISVRDFIGQINQVSTMILNNEIDIDAANSYCRLTRSFAQLITTETVKARFLKRQPDLTLENDVFEESK